MPTGLLMLRELIVDIILRGHHQRGINGQFDSIDITHHNDHAQGLRASRPFCQLWLVALSHVANRNQRAGIIIKPHFAHPETTDFWWDR
ncbi:hypothetical protein D3C76_1155220 [compost metagenome]